MNDRDSERLRRDEGERTSGMTGEPPPRLSARHDTEGIRFAPNFSVYVLPPDVVCLYSEDRKLFLYGDLYFALASLIGEGKPRQDIVRALSPKFPAGEIDEAFKRLHDRGFVAPATIADGPAMAYWTSLGLRSQVAAENLEKVRVRIEPMGTAGERELHAALRDLGVRLVDQAPDLTVVPVDDYLDGRLADVNDRQLMERKEWLLVQPSGIFPLVGPIFSPGKSACWTCLADRMKWNRQIKAFLDRTQARCVSASPLARHVLSHGGIGIAAVEIGKAIASGFRTDLHRHIVSLEMMGSTVARHYVAARPQCPSCGSKELRDPSRTPIPIRLRAGGRVIMTSGGFRSLAPAETVARHRKHVSALTGVVSQLERVRTDQPLDCSYLAKHNFSPRPQTVDELHAGLIGDSWGKGSTAEQGEASALMEAIERYCGMFQGDEIRAVRRFVDFPKGDAILPQDVLLLSDAQYEQGEGAACGHGTDQAAREAPAGRFDPTEETEWSPVWSLRDERFKYLPTGLLYFFHQGPGKNQITADSNGCAAGNTLEEAILQGFLELVERDAYAIWWYNRLRRPEIDLDKVGDSYVRDLRDQFAAMGRRLWVLDVTSDLGIPVVIAIAHWNDDDGEHIDFAAGAHFDLRIATLRALTELNQFMAITRIRGRPGDEGPDPLPVGKNAYVLPQGKAAVRRGPFAKFAGLDRREQVRACVNLVKRRGLDFLVLDQTRPDIEVPVVRVIVPGLRHFYRRFGPGRLYDVPVKLGLRRRPIKEAELNPLHPRT
jgi:ribosomal protein S12 methylthiotransferase accessory factor